MLKQQDQAFLQGAHEVVSRADSRASESPPSRWAPQTGKSGKTRNEEKCVMPQWRPSITGTSSRRWGRWGHRAGERHQRQHPLILQPRVPYSSELKLSLPNPKPAVCPAPYPPLVATEKHEGHLLSGTFPRWSSQKTHPACQSPSAFWIPILPVRHTKATFIWIDYYRRARHVALTPVIHCIIQTGVKPRLFG